MKVNRRTHFCSPMAHMMAERAERINMKQDGSIALFHYWNRLRDGRAAPKRTEIEPADIKSLLADTFILEKDTRGEAVFRLAGTRLCAIYGRELKGFSFSSLWKAKDQRLSPPRPQRFQLEIGRRHRLCRQQPQWSRKCFRAAASATRWRLGEPALPGRRVGGPKPFLAGRRPDYRGTHRFGACRRSRS